MASMTYTPEEYQNDIDRQRARQQQARSVGMPDVNYTRNTNTFWRVNEEISSQAVFMYEPLDEIRIAVAEWLM